jgi:hypothetical protein
VLEAFESQHIGGEVYRNLSAYESALFGEWISSANRLFIDSVKAAPLT